MDLLIAVGEIGMPDQGGGDAPHATLCWGEMDSNIRFPVSEIVIGGQQCEFLAAANGNSPSVQTCTTRQVRS